MPNNFKKLTKEVLSKRLVYKLATLKTTIYVAKGTFWTCILNLK